MSFARPRGGDGGLLFPCRKSSKSALKGADPLENPLNYGGICFLRSSCGLSGLNRAGTRVWSEASI